MTQHEWFYAVDGNQMGPVGTDELKRLATLGELKPTALVWRDGLSDWTPASKIPGLFAAPAPAPAPMAAPAAAPAADAPAALHAGGGYPAAPAPSYAAPAAVLPYGGGGVGSYGAGGGSGVTARAADLLNQTRPWVLLMAVLTFIGVALIAMAGLFIVLGGLLGSMGAPRGAGGGMVAGMGLVMGLFVFAFAALAFFPALYLWRYGSRIGQLRASGRIEDLESALEAQKSYWKFIGILTVVWLTIQIGFFFIGMLGALI
jgi:hypothetical protein